MKNYIIIRVACISVGLPATAFLCIIGMNFEAVCAGVMCIGLASNNWEGENKKQFHD